MKMKYYKGTCGDFVVEADSHEEAIKAIERRFRAGNVPLLEVEEVDMDLTEAEGYGTLEEPEGPWVAVEVYGLLVQDVHIFWTAEEAEEWFENYTEGLTPETLYDEHGNCVNNDYDQCKIFALGVL